MNFEYFTFNNLYPDLDCEKAYHDLSDIIKCQTISKPDQSQMDFSEFSKLHQILKNRFPLVSKNAKIDIVNKGSILFHIEGSNSKLPAILLMAHLDVVPVVEATITEWDYPPFSGEITDEFIYGRGTAGKEAEKNL